MMWVVAQERSIRISVVEREPPYRFATSSFYLHLSVLESRCIYNVEYRLPSISSLNDYNVHRRESLGHTCCEM